MSSSSILSNLPSFNKQSFSRANSRSNQRPPTTYFCTAETSKPQCIITLEKTSILHRHFEKLERQQQQQQQQQLLQQQQQQQQQVYTTTHYHNQQQQQQVSIDNNSTIITPSPLSSSVPLSNVLLPSSNNSHPNSLDVNATSSKRPTMAMESLVEERPNKTQKLTLNSDVSSSTAPHLQQYPNDE